MSVFKKEKQKSNSLEFTNLLKDIIYYPLRLETSAFAGV